jgi:hypothetical protein
MRVPKSLHLIALPAVAVLATMIFDARIRKEMIDFITWQQAIVHALHAEPLYPLDAGHYQFKYLPAFALLMAPFGMLNRETGKLFWFAIEVGLIAAVLRWSIAALPERRRAPHVLLAVAIVLMAKFYAHESCGKCTPCRLGSRRMERVFSDIVQNGAANNWDEIDCKHIISALKLTSLCGHGIGLGEFAESVLRHYRKELEPCFR